MRLPLALAALLSALPARAEEARSYQDIIKEMRAVDPRSSAKPDWYQPAADFAPPAPGSRLDLSWQFPTDVENQGPIGDCHAFASIAVLEAALARQYGRSANRSENLSEADLFIQGTMRIDRYYSSARFGGYGGVVEGGFLRRDLLTALHLGVASDGAMPYGDFMPLYKDKLKPMAEMNVRIADDNKAREDADAGRQGTASASTIEGAEGLISARFPHARASRSRNASRLAGFGLIVRDFDRPTARRTAGEINEKALWPKPSDLDSVECGRQGVEQGAFILSQLQAGRPVAIAMELTGLPGWDPSGRGGWHAFAVYGYENKDGVFSFLTRNSWGAKKHNYPIQPHHLCRVNQAATIKAPADRQ